MAIIPVPKPSKKAMNPERPINCLLLAQVEHLQHAERRLPLRYRSSTYTHAIRTEGEAARYVREVTEAIHKAHADAATERAKRARQAKGRAVPKAKDRKRKRGK
ncbi:MAG TPA: hypothetical protein VEJ46_04505 [Candidatus Acidoferrum sp.]|nr:hypothetical protein [Candidatus Acidoferrum sp.]